MAALIQKANPAAPLGGLREIRQPGFRLQGQPEKAYALLSPGYRKVRTFEQYRAQYGAATGVKAASVVNVTCEAEKCTARIKIEATPALMGVNVGTIATGLDETWLLEDGQWWRFQSL